MKVNEIYNLFDGRVDIEYGDSYENEITLNNENISKYGDYDIIEIVGFSYYGYGYEGNGIALRIKMEEKNYD